jgi:anthranilate synthase/aminodeoxychorismate synthase-like glutamine amidotransferase
MKETDLFILGFSYINDSKLQDKIIELYLNTTFENRYLIIDNYDSFTHNLERYFNYFGIKTDVVRNDSIIDDLDSYSAIIISPGPGKPKDSNLSIDIVKKYLGKKPILGVCLGMQLINEIYGGRTSYSNYPIHGKKSEIINIGGGLYNNLPNKFIVGRYHSLKIVPADGLEVDSHTVKESIPMSIRDIKKCIYGVQYHPESFLTVHGFEIIENFIEIVRGFYAK